MVEVVINQNDGFVSITAVGGETDLDFDFPIYEKSHLRIIRTRSGVDTILVLDTDYTIATDQLQVTAGGTAVLAVAATAGDVYSLLLDVPEERTTDFNQAGDFFAATVNREMDLTAQQIQQLRRDVDKAATLPETSTLTSIALPSPEADKIVGWNSAGDALANYTPNTDTYINISSFGATLVDDANAAAARTTLGLVIDTDVQSVPSAGSWTPSPTGVTVVGTPTYTGTYTKVGNIVFVTLQASATTSIAGSSAYFDGLPFTVSASSAASAVDSNSTTSIGVGQFLGGGTRLYVPNWSATPSIAVSGFYFV